MSFLKIVHLICSQHLLGCWLYSINDIPNEVLTQIFCLTVQDPFVVTLSEICLHNTNISPTRWLCIHWVCTIWRDIINSDSWFWRSVDTLSIPKYLDLQFSQVSRVSLSVQAREREPDSVKNLFTPLAAQWLDHHSRRRSTIVFYHRHELIQIDTSDYHYGGHPISFIGHNKSTRPRHSRPHHLVVSCIFSIAVSIFRAVGLYSIFGADGVLPRSLPKMNKDQDYLRELIELFALHMRAN